MNSTDTIPPDETLERARRAAGESAPLIWLLGKAQSGKTSIVSELTGEDRGGVGNGFQRATLGPRVYTFPPELPVVRFLDTRGLGDEAGYDPAADLDNAASCAHLLLVVVRLEDSAVGDMLDVLCTARKRHPDWPLLVAQTRLHDLYAPGKTHVRPYPFTGTDADASLPGFSDDFRRALAAQRNAFRELPGSPPVFVPLDFTQPDMGFSPTAYGAEALWDALDHPLPILQEQLHIGRDPAEKARHQVILPWAFAAAGADALPVPFFRGHCLHRPAGPHEKSTRCPTASAWSGTPACGKKFTQLLGLPFGFPLRPPSFLLRQGGLKVVRSQRRRSGSPELTGRAYALGGGNLLCREIAAGRRPDRDRLRQTYAEIWVSRDRGDSAPARRTGVTRRRLRTGSPRSRGPALAVAGDGALHRRTLVAV